MFQLAGTAAGTAWMYNGQCRRNKLPVVRKKATGDQMTIAKALIKLVKVNEMRTAEVDDEGEAFLSQDEI